MTNTPITSFQRAVVEAERTAAEADRVAWCREQVQRQFAERCEKIVRMIAEGCLPYPRALCRDAIKDFDAATAKAGEPS